MKAPCMGCPDRHAECHSKCEKYIAYADSRKPLYDARLLTAVYNDAKRDRLNRQAKFSHDHRRR